MYLTMRYYELFLELKIEAEILYFFCNLICLN